MACSLTPPADLVADTIERPLSLVRHVPNISAMEWCHADQRSFSPRFSAPDGWASAVWANQFPARCERFLLVEDDLAEKGLGSTANILTTTLLYAMRQQRVLIEIPVDGTWRGGAKDVNWVRRSSRAPRWCGQPPFTLSCFYESWTHCATPPLAAAQTARVAWQGTMTNWPFQAKVVRVKLSWMFATPPIHQKGHAASDAARRFLFRPRRWVRRIGDCILRRDGLHGPFVSLFLRDSVEKRQEMDRYGHAATAVSDWLSITMGVTARMRQHQFFVQTSSHRALRELLRLVVEHPDAPLPSFTSNPRSDHDTWGTWSNLTANGTHATLQGTIGAVNAYIASRAGLLVAPTMSAWTLHLLSLMGGSIWSGAGAEETASTLLCCKCNGYSSDRSGNVFIATHPAINGMKPWTSAELEEVALRGGGPSGIEPVKCSIPCVIAKKRVAGEQLCKRKTRESFCTDTPRNNHSV